MKNIINWLKLNKTKYFVRAIGWTDEEVRELRADLNNERFIVVNKEVEIKRLE